MQNEQRLQSLDALRGLDTALIIGLGTLLWSMQTACPGSEFWACMREQMGHEPWEGLRAYDLIFPIFVYLAGISLNFSVRKQMGMGAGTGKLLLRMWKRAALLVLLGMLVNGPLVWQASAMRCASVLGLIGISGALAGSIVLAVRKTWAVGLCATLLLAGVFLAQYMGGDMTPAGCFNAKVDALLCLRHGAGTGGVPEWAYVCGLSQCGEARAHPDYRRRIAHRALHPRALHQKHMDALLCTGLRRHRGGADGDFPPTDRCVPHQLLGLAAESHR